VRARRKRGEKTAGKRVIEIAQKVETASATASTFPPTSLGGQHFHDEGKEALPEPRHLVRSSHGVNAEDLQRMAVNAALESCWVFSTVGRYHCRPVHSNAVLGHDGCFMDADLGDSGSVAREKRRSSPILVQLIREGRQQRTIGGSR
jgi:hypothetical protein